MLCQKTLRYNCIVGKASIPYLINWRATNTGIARRKTQFRNLRWLDWRSIASIRNNQRFSRTPCITFKAWILSQNLFLFSTNTLALLFHQ